MGSLITRVTARTHKAATVERHPSRLMNLGKSDRERPRRTGAEAHPPTHELPRKPSDDADPGASDSLRAPSVWAHAIPIQGFDP